MNKLVIGKTIMIPAMRRGLCKYADETVHLPQETLERMAATVHGIPVIIEHQPVNSGNIERVVVGRVADCHYIADTDTWDFHFVVDTQEAVDRLQNGWGVSTTYEIAASGPAGTLNNVPYDREVQDAKYLNLAIVQNPRYEMAKNPVFYNDKSDTMTQTNEVKGMKGMLFKLFRARPEEVKANEGEELCVDIGGVVTPLANVLEEMTGMESKPKQVLMQADDVVEYNGGRMKICELVEKYNKMKNEAEPKEKETPAEEKKESPAEEKKEASADEKPEEKKEEPAKENAGEPVVEPVVETPAPAPKEEPKANAEEAARFAALKDAPTQDSPVEAPQSLRERTVAGQARYGSGR